MNQKNMIAIITHSQPSEKVANTLCGQLKNVASYVSPGKETIQMLFETSDALIFIGALGICVRTITPFIKDKKTDPAVINLDVNGQYVQPVLSGHVGGANQLAKEIAAILGAIPVLTTVSDTQGLWPLDLLPQQYGWQMEPNPHLTRLMAAFVNRQPTALLLEARDHGTLMMETETPKHVTIHYARATLNDSKYQVVIAVTPFIHDSRNATVVVKQMTYSARPQLGTRQDRGIALAARGPELGAVRGSIGFRMGFRPDVLQPIEDL